MLDNRTIGQLEAQWKIELRPVLAAVDAEIAAHDEKGRELRIKRAAAEASINVVRHRIEYIRQQQAVAAERARQLAQLRDAIPSLEEKRREASRLGLTESVLTLTRDLDAATARR